MLKTVLKTTEIVQNFVGKWKTLPKIVENLLKTLQQSVLPVENFVETHKNVENSVENLLKSDNGE